MNRKVFPTFIVVGTVGVLILTLGSLPSSGRAQTLTINCNAGGTIGGALSSLKPGDTLVVTGTCNESVVIPADIQRIVLDGQGKATISAPPSRDAVGITGRDITIRGFTITGGQNGIVVARGGTAVIDGNTIQDAGKGSQAQPGSGILVNQHSFAAILNNTIQNNVREGIFVLEGSSARIGFLDVAVMGTGGNMIRNNGEDGIRIIRSSMARIVDTTITNNKLDGVRVGQNSDAGLANNTISGNGENGVNVAQVSSVNLRIGAGEPLGLPNKTDSAAQNRNVGVKCSTGSYVDGPLGTLTGTKGAKDVDKTCIDELKT